MKEVYVVTAGEYSDYSVCAIFTEKKLAQKYIDSFKEERYNDFNKIEVYSLNPYEQELKEGYSPYFVRMDKEGNVEECYISNSYYSFTDKISYGFDIKNNLYYAVFAKSAEHAIKIVNEKRVQLIATDSWNIKKK